ncbi:type II toxin-antitoxin system RelE/ParE family toxin [Xanthobacter sp. YC-JY1]|uniref:type II toxin-antitoxin system RelE/ParE family toxin n=1 Tax=Xanthobacter sp. YC-JY1 TaxID=2419844 RepID=UPI001F34336A|nr:type II toxin-antitoxin system RelE/ParE family toxin [Xanthobacter sp. YC-JY1]
MPQVRFSPAAIRDLERLRAFLSPKNPAAAKRAGEAIIDGVRALGTHPHMGPDDRRSSRAVSGLAHPVWG